MKQVSVKVTTSRRRVQSQHNKEYIKILDLQTSLQDIKQTQHTSVPNSVFRNVIRNRQHLTEYNNTMNILQKKTYEQVSVSFLKSVPSQNIRQRNLVDRNKQTLQQKLNEAEAQEFVRSLFRNNIKPAIKGYVQLPLQNEAAYTMPESRQGCRVVQIHNNGIVLGGHSHKEHIDISVLNLVTCQWRRKQEYYPTACEKLRSTLKHNSALALGSDFSVSVHENTIYTFGGQRSILNRRTSSVLTTILFTNEQVEWQQQQLSIPPRRNHTSDIVGNHMFIIGGMDDSGTYTKYMTDMYSVDITNYTTIQLFPRYYSKGIRQPSTPLSEGIAYHSSVVVGIPTVKLMPDYTQIGKVEESQPNLSYQEGIYIFGGKNQDDIMNPSLLLLQVDNYPPTLIEIQTEGQVPEPRRSCTLNYDESISALILFGGTDDHKCFGDLFMMFLKNKLWVQVKLQGFLNYHPRFDHCAIFHENKLIIFGGLGENGYLMFHPLQIQIRFKKIRQFI